MRDRSGIRRDIAIGACMRVFDVGNTGVVLAAAECHTSSSETDRPYDCTFEEAVYEDKLSELIASLLVSNVQPEMFEGGAPVSTSILLVVLPWPFDDLWYCRAHEYGQNGVGFEERRRMPPLCLGISPWWHDVKVFSLPPADLLSLYAPVPAGCGTYEVSRVLYFWNPSAFAYFSDYISLSWFLSQASSSRL